jgi:hypothetical protein
VSGSDIIFIIINVVIAKKIRGVARFDFNDWYAPINARMPIIPYVNNINATL